MDLLQAKALAEKAILFTLGEDTPEIYFYDEKTLIKPYGWVFFYTSKDFFITGNPLDSLIGVGPVVVNSISGTTEILGTAMRYTYYLDEYEKSLGIL